MRTDTDILLFKGWSLVVLGLAIIFGYSAIVLRRFWLGFTAACSLLIAVTALLILPLTWNEMWDGGVQCSGTLRGAIDLDAGSSHGTLRFSVYVSTGGYPLPWPGRIGLTRETNHGAYQFKRDNITSFSPFLEDRIGLQIGHCRIVLDDGREVRYEYEAVIPHWLFVLLFCPWFPLIWYLRRRRLWPRGFPISSPQGTPSAHPPS